MSPRVGIDVVPIDRVRRILERWSDDFSRRVLTEQELDGAPADRQQRARYVAGRIALKEAVLKALGTGLRTSLQEVTILRRPSQAPQVRLDGEAAATLAQIGGTHVEVSLTHDAQLAIAVAWCDGGAETNKDAERMGTR